MQATTYINNLLVGKRNLDHRGNFEVVNMATNDAFQCSIKEPFFARSRHEVWSMQRHYQRSNDWIRDVCSQRDVSIPCDAQ